MLNIDGGKKCFYPINQDISFIILSKGVSYVNLINECSLYSIDVVNFPLFFVLFV